MMLNLRIAVPDKTGRPATIAAAARLVDLLRAATSMQLIMTDDGTEVFLRWTPPLDVQINPDQGDVERDTALGLLARIPACDDGQWHGGAEIAPAVEAWLADHGIDLPGNATTGTVFDPDRARRHLGAYRAVLRDIPGMPAPAKANQLRAAADYLAAELETALSALADAPHLHDAGGDTACWCPSPGIYAPQPQEPADA